MEDLGELSIRFRDLTREESTLDHERATGSLPADREARLRAVTEVLDEIEGDLASRRALRERGSDDLSVADKYFAHTLTRWPRSRFVILPGFFRRGTGG